MAWTSSEVVYYIVRPIFCVLLGFALGWIYKRFFKKPAPCITCQVRQLLNAPETITGEIIYNDQQYCLPNLLRTIGVPQSSVLANRIRQNRAPVNEMPKNGAPTNEMLQDEVPMNEMPQNMAAANGIPENGEIGNRVNESDNGNVQS